MAETIDPVAGVSHVATEFFPDWALAPGALIQKELDAGGFSQADVATRTNLSAKHLNQVLKGHVPISPDVALALERVLDVPAELWLRMDVTWQAAKARESAQHSFSALIGWVCKFPADVLTRYAIVDPSDVASAQVEKMLRFFQVADTKAFEKVWLTPQANYKRSQHFEIDPYATALWLRLAEIEGERLLKEAEAYDAGTLRKVAQRIPSLTLEPTRTAFRHAQSRLLKAGVLLVFVPEIAGTRICGASRWLNSSHPMIALSGRHKFLDIFWFTLLHEIAHILLHPKRATYLEVEQKRGVNDDADQQEAAANSFAESLLLTDKERTALVEIEDAQELVDFANAVHLSPGIVAGQFAHLSGDWRRFGKLRLTADLATELNG